VSCAPPARGGTPQIHAAASPKKGVFFALRKKAEKKAEKKAGGRAEGEPTAAARHASNLLPHFNKLATLQTYPR
jgi:hypothetical protein